MFSFAQPLLWDYEPPNDKSRYRSEPPPTPAAHLLVTVTSVIRESDNVNEHFGFSGMCICVAILVFFVPLIFIKRRPSCVELSEKNVPPSDGNIFFLCLCACSLFFPVYFILLLSLEVFFFF